MRHNHSLLLLSFLIGFSVFSQHKRARDLGIKIGVFETGELNAITDVKGVTIGHKTLIQGENIRTGVTAIIPHQKNLYQYKVPAAIYIGNGFGKLTGYSQVKELGNIETPIILTNTLNVPVAAEALISYTLNQKENHEVRSVNAVVGETNDGYLNDIRGRHLKEKDVFEAISNFTDDYQIILPAHPRLKNYIENNNIKISNVILIDPLSYVDFMSLVYGCELVLTDSGGIQEETTYLGISCLTLREETERPITVQEGTNKVIGTDKENIINEINNVLGSKISNEAKIKYWDGETSGRIFQILFG